MKGVYSFNSDFPKVEPFFLKEEFILFKSNRVKNVKSAMFDFATII